MMCVGHLAYSVRTVMGAHDTTEDHINCRELEAYMIGMPKQDRTGQNSGSFKQPLRIVQSLYYRPHPQGRHVLNVVLYE